MSQSQAGAEAFWDGHHHILEDPGFWMAHPLGRAAINQRVSGDPNVWPLTALGVFAGRPLRRALSLGCGTGSLERTAMRQKMFGEIDAVDSSEASLQIAKERASEEGLEGIRYRRGDLNDLRLPRHAYDVVIFHQSLHHVVAIEKLLARVASAIAPDGLLALDEWTGPSRDEWDDKQLARVRRMFQELPPEWRRWPQLRDPIEHDDPSEAVRSSAILPAVRRLFNVLVERPYGGHIAPILMSQVALDKIPPHLLDRLVSRWLAIEDEDLARDPALSFHTALIARPRTGIDGLASRSRAFLIRAGRSVGYDPTSVPDRARHGKPDGEPQVEHCDKDLQEIMALFHREKRAAEEGPVRLHIGCGQEAIPGWINIDNRPLPGVDRVLDVRHGLPFRGAAAIYAEHFLEHLTLDDGLAFLRECRRALAPSGVLRLSTPNLDWVYATHYRMEPTATAEESVRDCLWLNRAFHGWGHRFLYNRTMLEAALKSCGYAIVRFQRYGQSDVPELSGIEKHETWQDTAEMPHVLIAEASGQAAEEPLPATLVEDFRVAVNTR
jgi:2-polyprenyl-3-methyl-5-hydroxy-6-metoxy-1,4-benzoquinol methylase